MSFKKKAMKGVRGVVSHGVLEGYLQEIMRLENELKSRDIKIGMLKTKLESALKELKSAQKRLAHQEKIIQKHGDETSELRLKIEKLMDENAMLSREKTQIISTFNERVADLPERDEFIEIARKKEQLEKENNELRKTLARREAQVLKLTEENLKLKDRLKFLKET